MDNLTIEEIKAAFDTLEKNKEKGIKIDPIEMDRLINKFFHIISKRWEYQDPIVEIIPKGNSAQLRKGIRVTKREMNILFVCIQNIIKDLEVEIEKYSCKRDNLIAFLPDSMKAKYARGRIGQYKMRKEILESAYSKINNFLKIIPDHKDYVCCQFQFLNKGHGERAKEKFIDKVREKAKKDYYHRLRLI